MKILDKIKQPFITARENYRAKRKEKLLIKTDDDELVVDSLPAEEDNSAINIHKVVETMEDPENMVEVVKNNLPELMEQDMVKDTMKYLKDDGVIEVIEENKKELKEQGKIALAIQAIDDTHTRLEVTEENLKHLTATETATILKSVKERETEKAKELENRKIKTASEQILRTLVKYGHVSQLDIKEMAHTLQEESSKLAIIKLCLATINQYDVSKSKNITAKAKRKMVYDLLNVTNVDIAEKYRFMSHSIIKDELMTEAEASEIMQDLEKEKARKEQLDKEREARIQAKNYGGYEHE